MYAAVLNTAGADYDTIIATQETAFKQRPWATNYWITISIDWSKALIKIYWEVPTWDTVLLGIDTAEEQRQYMEDNPSDWDKHIN